MSTPEGWYPMPTKFCRGAGRSRCWTAPVAKQDFVTCVAEEKVPIFLITASILMATSSVSLLDSKEILVAIPRVGTVFYFGNQVLRNDVALEAGLLSYNHLYIRNYEGGTYKSNTLIGIKINTMNWKIEYHARELFAGLSGKVAYSERDSDPVVVPMIGVGLFLE